jgi:hypothetical protein
MLITRSDDINKPLEQWTNKDFLFYFSNKLASQTGKGLRIEGPAWIGFLSRIKGFRNKLHLSNQAYKDFIDKVFGDFFARDGYVPAFGAIVSERVYFIVTKYSGETHLQYSDFEQVRRELYGNNTLFAQFSGKSFHESH